MTNNGIIAKRSFHRIWISNKNRYWNGPQAQAVCNVKLSTFIIRSRPKLTYGAGRNFGVGPQFGATRKQPIIPKQKLLTILIYNSHPILMQFSCNNRWDFQKCPCNSHLQFSSNSHQTILTYNSHPILTYNSHPILTWQFSSNFHLTILIQFSPDNSHPILTYNSHSILINTAQSILTNNAQPIFS